jgi:hypothetical protein
MWMILKRQTAHYPQYDASPIWVSEMLDQSTLVTSSIF